MRDRRQTIITIIRAHDMNWGTCERKLIIAELVPLMKQIIVVRVHAGAEKDTIMLDDTDDYDQTFFLDCRPSAITDFVSSNTEKYLQFHKRR